MKRTKKMLALVLALMMAFTCLAMPAMAAGEDEGIMPLKPVPQCIYCGRSAEFVTRKVSGTAPQGEDCPWVSTPHQHNLEYEYEYLVCLQSDTCGKSEFLGFTIISDYCTSKRAYVPLTR